MSKVIAMVPPLPKGHSYALHAAAKEMSACIHELPESVYHLSPDDAEWMTSRVVTAYLAALERKP